MDETNDNKEIYNTLRGYISISLKQYEQQQIIHEEIIAELKEIKRLLPIFVQMIERLNVVEQRQNNSELRLSHVEKLLRAS